MLKHKFSRELNETKKIHQSSFLFFKENNFISVNLWQTFLKFDKKLRKKQR